MATTSIKIVIAGQDSDRSANDGESCYFDGSVEKPERGREREKKA